MNTLVNWLIAGRECCTLKRSAKQQKFKHDQFYVLIISSLYHWIPRTPCATSAKPTVEPTMLCVAETGNLSNVAAISQTQEPCRSKPLHVNNTDNTSHYHKVNTSATALAMVKMLPHLFAAEQQTTAVEMKCSFIDLRADSEIILVRSLEHIFGWLLLMVYPCRVGS